MKRTLGIRKVSYSVAVAESTGCVVMLRIEPDQRIETGQNLKVMGSLDREQSLKLAEDVTKWTASIAEAVKDAVEDAPGLQ